MTSIAALRLDPARYQRHPLHGDGVAWLEKNCYIDVWIEVLHARGLDPMAVMPFALVTDFEGDQWTFFKPPHGDLRTLYGVDTQELNVWRPLVEHAVRHLGEGKLVFTEADAFWLPDTQGTDYRRQHTKSTIVIETIDVAARKLGYFHNAGYFALEGEDFVKLFRLDAEPDPTYMPFFAELVRLDRAVVHEPRELSRLSTAVLRECLARRPTVNPLRRFEAQFTRDIEWLQRDGLALYHAYAFATVRQCGAAFELGASYLRWLADRGEAEGLPAAADLDAISSSAKALIMKTARAVNAKKVVDFAPIFGEMANRWDHAMDLLVRAYPL